jgi:hypothetical protein
MNSLMDGKSETCRAPLRAVASGDLSGTFELARRVMQAPRVPVNGPAKRVVYFCFNLNRNP